MTSVPSAACTAARGWRTRSITRYRAAITTSQNATMASVFQRRDERVLLAVRCVWRSGMEGFTGRVVHWQQRQLQHEKKWHEPTRSA